MANKVTEITRENLCWYQPQTGSTAPAYVDGSFRLSLKEYPHCKYAERFWRTGFKNNHITQTSLSIVFSYLEDCKIKYFQESVQGFLRKEYVYNRVIGLTAETRFMIHDVRYPHLTGLLCSYNGKKHQWVSGRFLHVSDIRPLDNLQMQKVVDSLSQWQKSLWIYYYHTLLLCIL